MSVVEASENTNPLISVIVPVYKVEQYLDRCIESIVNQTYKNLEIILVDDGSPDNCPKMCDDWEKKDSRIKVIHKENGGVSSARNAGIEIAGGTFVHFVDSDDWVDISLYEKVVNNFDCGMLIISSYFVGDEEKSINYNFDWKENADDLTACLVSGKLGWTNCWNKVFLLQLIKKNNLKFDERLRIGEDFFFAYQYIRLIDKTKFLNEPLYYYYCTRGSSAMNTVSSDYLTRWKVTEKILLNEKDNDIVLKACLIRLYKEALSSTKISAINDCFEKEYYETAAVIKRYYRDYKRFNIQNNTKKVQLISICPKGFRILYRLWKKIKK